jgi:hypothetical protein
MLAEGCEPTHHVINALLNAHAFYGNLRACQQILHGQLLARGLAPDTYTSVAMLTAAGRSNTSLLGVEAIHAHLTNLGVPLNEFVGTALITAYKHVPVDRPSARDPGAQAPVAGAQDPGAQDPGARDPGAQAPVAGARDPGAQDGGEGASSASSASSSSSSSGGGRRRGKGRGGQEGGAKRGAAAAAAAAAQGAALPASVTHLIDVPVTDALVLERAEAVLGALRQRRLANGNLYVAMMQLYLLRGQAGKATELMRECETSGVALAPQVGLTWGLHVLPQGGGGGGACFSRLCGWRGGALGGGGQSRLCVCGGGGHQAEVDSPGKGRCWLHTALGSCP